MPPVAALGAAAVPTAVDAEPVGVAPGCSCCRPAAENRPGSADDRRAAAWCPACRR
ncbi:hypothetical protein D3C77_147060 [compost metagenome]